MRSLKTLLLAILCYLSLSCLAQKQAGIWYFGGYGGLDFRNGNPIELYNSGMRTEGGSAVISNKDGNPLFYTDGVTIWNKNNKPMPNGHGLWGSSVTAQTLIVPQPGNDSLFYIFTASPLNDFIFGPDSSGFHYSIVNINKDGGLGDVIQKNTLLFKNTTEKMTAVSHADGKDVWLVAHEWGNNSFRSYLINENGIDATNVIISNTGSAHSGGIADNTPNQNAGGQMKLSPNGEKIALTIVDVGLQVFDFNDLTGQVSNPTSLISEAGAACSNGLFLYYGIEFSPNSKFLYYDVYQQSLCHGITLGYMKRYNLQDKTIVTIGESQERIFDELQLALDGKIYAACNGTAYLASIQDPNNEKDAGFLVNGFHLADSVINSGLPNFIQSYFLFPDPVLEMPNVFTPNGDIYNERFVPIHFENINSASLTIVNRWGEQVFYTENIEVGWDGGNLSVGTYYWFLSYYGKNGKQGSQKGWVQLIR